VSGPSDPVRLVAHAAAASDDAPDDLETRFPGRWDPRRGLDPKLRPLVAATAAALEAAGWWSPAAPEPVAGGLVCAVDLAGTGKAEVFCRRLGSGALRPAPFLHAVPSTPAATLGLLFGLTDYQTTLMGDAPAALAHARDLIAVGRRERIVVAGLTAVDQADALGLDRAWAHAVAWCLAR